MDEDPISQYRAMNKRHSYGYSVYGFFKQPRKECGSWKGLGYRNRKFVAGHLPKQEAYALANSLNALNALPLQDLPAPRKRKPKASQP